MNKHKQENIELLSEYMDKTSAKWCLFFRCSNENWSKNPYYQIHDDFQLLNEDRDDNFSHRDWGVLWHHDITALFKIPNLHVLRTDDEYIYLQYWEYGKEFEIPNKPLNLYTEQEYREVNIIIKELLK